MKVTNNFFVNYTWKIGKKINENILYSFTFWWQEKEKKENLVNVKCFEKLCQNSTNVNQKNRKKSEKKVENNSRKRIKMITLCLMENENENETENERKRIFLFLFFFATLLRLHMKQYNIIFNVASAATCMDVVKIPLFFLL